MRCFFDTTPAVIEHMFRLLVYQVIFPYDSLVNKAFILSTFLFFRYSHIGINLGLIKNIVINLFVLLLACMNLAYAYSTLFLNISQLLSSITGILAISAMTSLYPISSPACSLL